MSETNLDDLDLGGEETESGDLDLGDLDDALGAEGGDAPPEGAEAAADEGGGLDDLAGDLGGGEDEAAAEGGEGVELGDDLGDLDLSGVGEGGEAEGVEGMDLGGGEAEGGDLDLGDFGGGDAEGGGGDLDLGDLGGGGEAAAGGGGGGMDVVEASRAKLTSTEAVNLDFLLDVKLDVTFEVGRSKMMISDLLTLGQGSVIELHRLVGEELDFLVNGKLVAKGEVVVVNEKFGMRITEIVSPADRIKHLAGY